jgi:hypothetical protein
MKGIKQSSINFRTHTKLPGTETPLVRGSNEITGNNDLVNTMKNMNNVNKNPFMGQRSSMTYTKNFNQHQTNTSLPSTKTGMEPVKLQENIELRKALILETTVLRNKIDHGIEGGKATHGGSKDSGVHHGKLAELRDYNKPRKPRKEETRGIQNMSERKRNQGLTYLQKKDTQERNNN